MPNNNMPNWRENYRDILDNQEQSYDGKSFEMESLFQDLELLYTHAPVPERVEDLSFAELKKLEITQQTEEGKTKKSLAGVERNPLSNLFLHPVLKRSKLNLYAVIAVVVVIGLLAASCVLFIVNLQSQPPTFEPASGPGMTAPNCPDLTALDCVLKWHPELQKPLLERGTEVNLTQTLDNITFHVDRIYIDSLYALVSYSFTVPKGISIYSANPSITFENQTSLPGTWTSEAVGKDGAIGIVKWVDVSNLSGLNGKVKLKMEIPGVTREMIPVPSVTLASSQSQITSETSTLQPPVPTATPAPIPTTTNGAKEVQQVPDILGPFMLEFTANVTPSTILEPKQQVTAKGKTGILEKVIITPLIEQLVFSGLGPNPDVSIEVIPGDAEVNSATPTQPRHDCRSVTSSFVYCEFEAGTLEKSKEYKIIIRQNVAFPLPTYPPCAECAPGIATPTPQFSQKAVEISGPWIFRLSLTS